MTGGTPETSLWAKEYGLTDEHAKHQREFADFAEEYVRPYADRWDAAEELPGDIVRALAGRGWLGSPAPARHGGPGHDAVTFGLLNEAMGHACSSLRSLLTVHGMAVQAVGRWGSPALRERWLPELTSGRTVGAFALTEPEAGSDAADLRTAAEEVPGGYRLTGTKRWITFGRIAGVYLLFARAAAGVTAFLVERDSPGLRVEPVGGLLGTRAAMTAELRLDGCFVPARAMVGRPGFGLAAVAAAALEWGRYSVAWGCAGLARACVDATAAYAVSRTQFGRPIGEHQLVQRMLTEMAVGAHGARLACLHAGRLMDLRSPQAVPAVWSAKYLAARAAFRAAADAVQVHGANGCAAGSPVQRHLRDAKVMEIIEGTTEIQQTIIARSVLDRQPNRTEKVHDGP